MVRCSCPLVFVIFAPEMVTARYSLPDSLWVSRSTDTPLSTSSGLAPVAQIRATAGCWVGVAAS